MNDQSNLEIQPIKDLLTKANDIFVLFPSISKPDIISGSLALYKSLTQTNKNILIATPQSLNTNKFPLPGADQVQNHIGNRNLVISLKVDGRESIDKVSYNLDEAGQVFNLIIQPKKDHSPISSQDVSYSYAGAQADLVFIIAANKFEDLGDFYDNEKKLFSEAATVSLNHYPPNPYANHSVSDPNASSLSEVIGQFIQQLGLKLDPDAATNLLYGLDKSTNKLQHPTVTASTFELAAQLLRAGGSRQPIPQPSPASTSDSAGSVPVDADNTQDKGQVPKDWLAPKIYKSPSRS